MKSASLFSFTSSSSSLGNDLDRDVELVISFGDVVPATPLDLAPGSALDLDFKVILQPET
jgi:hypothetical protein